MLIGIVQHDPGAVVAGPGAVGVPEGVVKEDRAARRGADFQGAGEQVGPLQVVRVRRVGGLVAAGDDAETAIATLSHVGQVIADLELQQGDRVAEAAEGVVVTVLVPAHAAAYRAIFHDRIRGVVMGARIEQSCDIGPERRPIDQLQE